MPHKAFKSFKSEVEKESITFEFDGEQYTVEEPSFILKLHISSLFSGKSADTKLTMADFHDVIKLLLGDENFARFLRSKADDTTLMGIITYILNPYASDEDTSPNEQKATATKTARSRSTKS